MIMLYNQSGQKIQQQILDDNEREINLNLSGLPSGIYIVRWINGSGRFSEKLIVQ